MKKLLFIPLLGFMFLFSCEDSTQAIPCSSIMDCPEGSTCDLNEHICVKGNTEYDASTPDITDVITDTDSGGDGSVNDVFTSPDGGVVTPDGSIANCWYIPPPGEFSPVRECRWNNPTYLPLSNDVVMTPVVANLTDDNGDGVVDTRDIPDIAFISYDRNVSCCNAPGTLRVISGKCGDDGQPVEHFSIDNPVLDNSAGIAIGDIDGDGVPDIVSMLRQVSGASGTVAYDNNGNVKWQSPYPVVGEDLMTAAQPAIDDLDGDGLAEIIVGRVVLNGTDGSLKWKGVAGMGINAFMGPMSFSADINLDGRKEVIAGNTAYRADGLELWTFEYPSSASGCQSSGYPCDGYSAAGNFNDDPEGEVVIVRSGDLWILTHEGELFAHIPIPRDDCSYNEGGPPTVADFDGDGKSEIGVAGADFYVVFDLDCCDSFPECNDSINLPADCEAPGIRWSVPNNDCSSRVTGSSVFDFDGDGSAEVVYNDETMFRIFSGNDGTILFEEPNTSHTRLEYPIIADVDNDGNAEIVFIENTSNTSSPDHGVEIWGDSSDRWVPTRRIWNQHMYYVTNINEDGTIPPYDNPPNWLLFNNFRQNMPDYNVFAAPDLQLEILSIDKTLCYDSVEIMVSVCNDGDLRVGGGVNVTFLDNETNNEIICEESAVTTQTLEPGDCETISCTWNDPPRTPEIINISGCVDNTLPDCVDGGSNNECIETNNLHSLTDEGCDGPIE
ncbi:MAG: VCBS repeat-containing protein [Deltaproteobacteria bacterium]|nr:VCBS repeat-containing protein [Deltaproteobacteria bacterium]